MIRTTNNTDKTPPVELIRQGMVEEAKRRGEPDAVAIPPAPVDPKTLSPVQKIEFGMKHRGPDPTAAR